MKQNTKSKLLQEILRDNCSAQIFDRKIPKRLCEDNEIISALISNARQSFLEEDEFANNSALQDYVGDKLSNSGIPEKSIRKIIKTVEV